MIYAMLADGRDEKEMLQLEMALAPTPELKEVHIDRANAAAMEMLGGGNQPPPVPLPHRRRN